MSRIKALSKPSDSQMIGDAASPKVKEYLVQAGFFGSIPSIALRECPLFFRSEWTHVHLVP